MAHIHLEDGSFTLFWAVAWAALCALVLIACVIWLRKVRKIDNRSIVIAAMCTAAAFAVFQVSIPLFGGVHLNLTPLIGILAGPVVGSVIVLIVNIFSAAIGHGGWTLLGANTLVNLSEVMIAYGLFRALKGMDTFSRAGIATLIGLLAGNVAMMLIIIISGVQGAATGLGDYLPGLLNGTVTVDTVINGVTGLAAGLILIAAINMGVAILEALMTGYIVSYLKKVRPDMIGEVKNEASE